MVNNQAIYKLACLYKQAVVGTIGNFRSLRLCDGDLVRADQSNIIRRMPSAWIF